LADAFLQEMMINSTHDLVDVFGKIDYNPNNNDISKNQFEDSDAKSIHEYLDLELIGHIEETFQCSGMCQNGLFYFSKNITEGIPIKTCLQSIHTRIVSETKGFGTMSTLVGLLALWCFMIHFFIYAQHKEDEQ
jgi:hypothetical protein